MSERYFAHGENKRSNCTCPAVTAGFIPQDDENVRHVAVEYDTIVGEKPNNDYHGIISEDEARRAWKRAVRRIRGRRESKPGAVKAGEKIAEELGWSL